MQIKSVNRIAIIGILTALNVASRVYLTFLPNIQPATSIIILSVITFGFMFAIMLVISTVLVSGLVFGLGITAVMQILAWSAIVMFSVVISRHFSRYRLPTLTVWAFLCGYIYGFIVSLDKLLISPTFFIVYYANGLVFDTLHAIGNLIFFPLCYTVLLPIFRRYTGRKDIK